MLTDQQMKEALAQSPSPNRVTEDYIKSRISKTTFHGPETLDGQLTLCILEINNGFTVTGESACADPANYNKNIGETIAYKNAFEKLWPVFGFLLKETLHLKVQDVAKTAISAKDDSKALIQDVHDTLNTFESQLKAGKPWAESNHNQLATARSALEGLFEKL